MDERRHQVGERRIVDEERRQVSLMSPRMEATHLSLRAKLVAVPSGGSWSNGRKWTVK